ncbi:hypothetical protein UYO_2113 [Lachnospiraceae bacterium JC7]|nr:hypothetical protein UYO_2113 [Lachnospiraceae bacterium JC7]
MEQKRIEGLWDCVFCGSRAIRARFATCPNCGKSRGIDTVFYLPEDTGEAALTEEQAAKTTDRPDWLCGYCDSYNRSDAAFCKKCGAPRSHSNEDYGTLHKDRD